MEPVRIWEMAKFSNPQLILLRLKINQAVLLLIAKLLQMSRILENVAIVSNFSVVKELISLDMDTVVGTMLATILLAKTMAIKKLLQLTLERKE